MISELLIENRAVRFLFNHQSRISNQQSRTRVRIATSMSEPQMVLNNPVQIATREQDLIQSVQRGQHELFYELVRPYERRVYAAALAILRNEHDAEDAAQDAMLKAFANIRQFRAEARFSTWLIQITVNEALMRRRR